jgi:ABC transport system ATP-binding/permease protein
MDTASILTALHKKKTIIIGRPGKVECDIEFNDKSVSRPHCKLELTADGRLLLTDLNSKNHTYVNSRPVINETVEITPEDVLIIGNQVFSLKKDARNRQLALSAKKVKKQFPNGVTGVHSTSLHIIGGDFVAIMGPSGCGKSTLLRLLAGADPASGGEVSVFGKDLHKEYSSIKEWIGYVPQDDIVHKELTVEKALYYAYRLRNKEVVADSFIEAKISEVLGKLNLKDQKIRRSQVGELSGGQRKRISIAIELLSDPKILFLDEPTSPLDPETIEEFLNCLQELAQQGTTVIMVTHKPEDLSFVDKVIWMGNGGYLVYEGAKDKFLAHFGRKNVVEVYSYLYNKEKANELYDAWQPDSGKSAPAATPMEASNGFPLWTQYFLLTARYFEIKWNDKGYMYLLLAQGPIIAILIGLIFDKFTLSVLFMINLTAIWLGASNAAREIVGELPIYNRERMYNLGLVPYIASKLTVLTVFSMVQVVLFISILYLFYVNRDIGMSQYFLQVGTMTFVAFSSILAGLLLSALVKTSEQAIALLPLLLIPQIIFSGVIYPIDHTPVIEFFSIFSFGRQGTDAFAVIQGSVEHMLPLCTPGPDNVLMPGLAYGSMDASEALALPDTLGIPSGTLSSSLSVIGILCILTFGGVLAAMKKKDRL